MNLAALGGALSGFESKFDPAAIIQGIQQKQAQAALIKTLLQNGGTMDGAPPVPGAGGAPMPPPSLGPSATPAPVAPTPNAPPTMGAAPQAPVGSSGMSGAGAAGAPIPPGMGASQPAALPGASVAPTPPPQAGAPPLPPTPAAAGGGQLSGVATGTSDPVTAMRQTLKTMAMQIAQANPKMKGSQLFGAMQQELALMHGVEPAVKDAMSQYIETQKLQAKYAGMATTLQAGLQRVQGAKDIESMKQANAELLQRLKDEFGLELQGMKDDTAESVADKRAAATTTAAGERAGATVTAAQIGAGSREAVGAGHDATARDVAGTRAGAARDVARTNATAGVQKAGITAGERVKAPPGVAKLPDGTRLQKDGRTWVKQGAYVVPE